MPASRSFAAAATREPRADDATVMCSRTDMDLTAGTVALRLRGAWPDTGQGGRMQIQCFTVGQFQVITYPLTDESSGQSAIVDTGETDELVRRLQMLTPAPDIRLILLTHTHLDHAGALPDLQTAWPEAITVMPAADRPLFETLPMQGSMFGMPHLDRMPGRIDREVEDGDLVQLGETALRVLSTPGHTPGQCCYHTDTDIIVGDTLFAGSIGRTDFPLSNPRRRWTASAACWRGRPSMSTWTWTGTAQASCRRTLPGVSPPRGLPEGRGVAGFAPDPSATRSGWFGDPIKLGKACSR